MARPHADLLLAYRGTAAFLRRTRILAEAGGLEPVGTTVAPRRVIATVGYGARALAAFAEGIRLGSPVALSTLSAERDEQVALGVSLPVRGLEHLASHSAVHLRVEWRDLPDDSWDVAVPDRGSDPADARMTVGRRAEEVWAAAVALGARPRDVPESLSQSVYAFLGIDGR